MDRFIEDTPPAQATAMIWHHDSCLRTRQIRVDSLQ
jgi:hypothetical protein